jgi:hypothetical protein
MLGLTVGCARCHDHKFDAIPTRDYYRMVAAFRSFDRGDAPLSSPHRDLERWLEQRKAELREEKLEEHRIPEEDRILLRVPLNRNNSGQKAVYREYDDRLQYTEEEFRSWLGPQGRTRLEQLERAVADAERLHGKPDEAFVVLDQQAQPIPSHLLGRGDARNKVEEVPFGFLTVLDRGKSPEQYIEQVSRPHRPTTFQRSALAEWLVDADHGAGNLVARVIVNRLWQHHFGTGLVGTPNDFGLQGDRPTHPELLDWLASELVRGGWRLKPIHRLILQSAVYRQSADFDAKKAEIDPDNQLHWRRRPVRIEGEILRDAILQASGWLDTEMYGPAVRPFIPQQAISTRTKDKWPEDIADGPDVWRRSVYLFVKRSVRLPMMETFDSPDTNLSCGRRVPTTVPTQALALMNDDFVREQARRLATRLEQEALDRKGRIALAYRLTLGREPAEPEWALAEEFLASGSSAQEQRLSLVDFCHALFTLNEFFFID